MNEDEAAAAAYREIVALVRWSVNAGDGVDLAERVGVENVDKVEKAMLDVADLLERQAEGR